MLLLATMVSLCAAQRLHDPNTEYRFRPAGELVQEINGSYSYIVGENDHCGQWQVAFGDGHLWSKLVQANSTKLENPDLIKKGDRLNVPDELVPLFLFVYGSDNLSALTPNTVHKVDTVEVEKEEKWTESYWFWLVILAIAAFLWLLASSITRQQERERYGKEESARRLSDPYSGPDQVKGGLPTAESAINHFANSYNQERSEMTVADSNQLPNRVRIIRMKAVDVRGPMEICYAGSKKPETKDIKDWTPAWQAFLDDGSWCISLMHCGNDVWFEGKRMKPLSEGEIRDRQEGTIEVNRQIWPTINNDEQPETTEKSVKDDEEIPQTPLYCEVVIKSPTRWLLHKHGGGNPAEINVALLGDMINLSFIGNQVIAETKDGYKRTIGEIGEDLSEKENPEKSSESEDDLDNMLVNKNGESGPGTNDNSDNENPAS